MLKKAFKLWDGQLYLTLVYIVFRSENAEILLVLFLVCDKLEYLITLKFRDTLINFAIFGW